MLPFPLTISSNAGEHNHPLTSHPLNKAFDSASLKSNTSISHTPHRITTNHSCPDLFKLEFDQQEVDSPPIVSQDTYESQQTDFESGPKSSLFRFSRSVKSGKFSKRAPSFSLQIRTPLTYSGQTGQFSSVAQATIPETTHINYLTPLTPGSKNLPSGNTEKLPSFTGGLDRESPVWQIIELKEKLAHHEEFKKKACMYSKRYKNLLAQFEDLRRISQGALKELEEDNENKYHEIRACRAESNRHQKIAEYWARLYDAEVAKVTALQNQLEDAMRHGSLNLDSTDSAGASSQLASDTIIRIGIHEMAILNSHEIVDLACSAVGIGGESQTAHLQELSNDKNISTATLATDENEGIPLGPQESQAIQLRYSFGSCFGKSLEDILHKLDDAPNTRP